MKSFLNKILDQPQSQPTFKFIPQIKISTKSTLHLQIQPQDPHTASNIVINAYQSKANRSIVPIRIEWSRYKFKSDEQFTVEKMPSVVGNTYTCEPSDLGSVIQAKVKCLDQMLGGEAQATIGPIRIDPMMKQLIDGALYNESLLSQVIVVEGQLKLNVNLRMGKNSLQFSETNSQQKLTMPYSFSEPKIQLSPKDPCKVYLRFQQDTTNNVRNWLNKITNAQKNFSSQGQMNGLSSQKQKNQLSSQKLMNASQKQISQKKMNESCLSIKVPHSNVSSMTSKTKLFQKSHVHCVNKLQVRFLVRSARDLFLFTLRAFICKQDMKNAVIMQRIQTLQGLKSQQDYSKFFEYISLKSQIIRLAELAKQLQHDRDSKLRDIAEMQESIIQTSATYMKIINAKSQEQNVDLEQSYSMISMKREEIMGRRNVRELRAQNQKLKAQIAQLNQQIQLQRFFKKDANDHSMVFNQTSNPFIKKQNVSNIIDQNHSSYYLSHPEPKPSDPSHKKMLQISQSYLKVLQQNKKLKEMSNMSKRGSQHDKSMGIQNLLESLHESEEEERRTAEVHGKVQALRAEVDRLNQQNKNLLAQNTGLKQRLLALPSLNNNQHPNSLNTQSPYKPDHSFFSNAQNNTSMISNSYISMNQSMTSQAQLVLLQKKLIELSNINAKFQSENTRLRRERDYFRGLYEKEINKINVMAPCRDNQQSLPVGKSSSINNQESLPVGKNNQHKFEDSLLQNGSQHENSVIIRLKEDRENLQNQKNSLLKKIDSLTRESNPLHKPDPTLQKRVNDLIRHNQRLTDENDSLKKTIQNMKSFHDLQKRQLLNSRTSNVNNGKDSNADTLLRLQEVEKLKKVNASLLNEIKQLRIQLQKKNDSNLDNSRVIELENQLSIFKTYAKENHVQGTGVYVNGSNSREIWNSGHQHLNIGNESCHMGNQNTFNGQQQTQRLIIQLTQLKKQNQRLKQQISTLQLKIKTQTTTIQKLMQQLDQLQSSNMNNSNTSSNFNKKYLTPETSPNKPSISHHNQSQTHLQQLQKYKKKLADVQRQLQMLRRNTQAVNRSRDLSMSMMGYEQERLQLYKKENQSLQIQIDNLNKMCSKYSKDAREANLQLSKLRAQVVMMNKAKLDITD